MVLLMVEMLEFVKDDGLVAYLAYSEVVETVELSVNTLVLLMDSCWVEEKVVEKAVKLVV